MMTSPSLYLFSALGSPVVPTALLINPGHAWLVLMVVLAASCLALWYITRPVHPSGDAGTPSRWFGKRMGRHHGHQPGPAFASHRTG
jgi:hypothetical protein